MNDMNKVDNSKVDRLLLVGISALCWGTAAWLALSLTGCAVFNPEGFGMKVQADIYAIHEREAHEEISTKKRPFICNFRNCDENGNVIKGS